MRSWIERMQWKAQKFMEGRFGPDEVYRFLSILSFIFIILSIFNGLFGILALFCLSLALFRCCSKNVEKREQERQRYLALTGKPKAWCNLQRLRRRDRHTHRYFKCRKCGSVLRVPINKGKIQITCPNCHAVSIRKT